MTEYRSVRKPYGALEAPVMEHLNEDAFVAGVHAFKAGKPEVSSLRLDEDGHKEFLRGWNFAYFKAQRRARSIERSVREKQVA